MFFHCSLQTALTGRERERAEKESRFGNTLILLSHLIVLGGEMRYFPQATIEKNISSLLWVSCQGEILTPALFPFFCEHPSSPKGPLVNMPSHTHTGSTHFHSIDIAYVTEVIKSPVAHLRDKASKSTKQTKFNDESQEILRNYTILLSHLFLLSFFPSIPTERHTYIRYISTPT